MTADEVLTELRRRAAQALADSRTAPSEHRAAALRGKARGLREAVDLLATGTSATCSRASLHGTGPINCQACDWTLIGEDV